MELCICPLVYGCVLDEYTNYNNYSIANLLHRCYLLFTQFPVFWHTCFCCKNRDLGMEVTLFRSIMTIYSMLNSITLCLHMSELFDRCVVGEYSEETDRNSVKQCDKYPKVPFKISFLRLIN